MNNRRNLDSAQKNKNDEFFTQYEDVEREINAFLDFNKDIEEMEPYSVYNHLNNYDGLMHQDQNNHYSNYDDNGLQ